MRIEWTWYFSNQKAFTLSMSQKVKATKSIWKKLNLLCENTLHFLDLPYVLFGLLLTLNFKKASQMLFLDWMYNIVEKDNKDILRNANGSFQKPIYHYGRIHFLSFGRLLNKVGIHFRITIVCYLKNSGGALKL